MIIKSKILQQYYDNNNNNVKGEENSDKLNQKKLQDIENQLSKLFSDVSSIMATVRKELSK